MLPRVNLVRTDDTDYLLLSTADAISATIYSNGSWAKLLVDISVAFCAGIADPLVVDVGANLGAYAVPVAQKLAGAGGTVFAYEPQRVIFYQLCGNAFLNRLDNLHPFHSAIGNTNGTISLPNLNYASTTNVGGFSINSFAGRTNAAFEETGTPYAVPMRKLDSIAFPRAPALIKIDVEGFELNVLKGAKKLLKESNFPPILLEAWTEDWFAAERKQLIAHIGELGYECFFLHDEIIAQHPSHERQFQFGADPATGVTMVRVR